MVPTCLGQYKCFVVSGTLVPKLRHFSVTRLEGTHLCIHRPSQGDSTVYRDGDIVLFLLKGNVKRPQGPVVSVCLCRLGRGGSDGWLGLVEQFGVGEFLPREFESPPAQICAV